MITTKPTAPHWYSRDGELRDAVSLREARRDSLLPSVTSILAVLSKPAVEAWRREQCILTAMQLPRLVGEADDDYACRLLHMSDDRLREATRFGLDVHAACESLNMGGIVTPDPVLAPYVRHYADWLDAEVKKVIGVESVLVNERAGYAGRCDLHALTRRRGEVIVDIKTQQVKRGRPQFHDSWGMQLAAYATCLGINTGISVVINNISPDPCYIKIWENLEPYYKAFEHCLELWRFENDF